MPVSHDEGFTAGEVAPGVTAGVSFSTSAVDIGFGNIASGINFSYDPVDGSFDFTIGYMGAIGGVTITNSSISANIGIGGIIGLGPNVKGNISYSHTIDLEKNVYYGKFTTAISGGLIVGKAKANLSKILYQGVLPKNPNIAHADSFGPMPCFPAGTLISLPDGSTLPIEVIAAKQDVTSFAEHGESGVGPVRVPLRAGRVTRTFRNVTTEWIELNWIDPVSGEARTLTATPGHVMLTTEGTYRQLGEMVTGGRKTEDGRRKGEMVVSPSHLRGSEGRAVARPGRGGGRERQRAISDSFTPTPMLRIDPPHKGEGKVPRTGVPLAKGQRFGVPIGTVELVADTGAVVLAQAYLLQYSAATADLFEQAG